MYAAFKYIQSIALQDLRLYFSPFSGAIKAIKIELARPKSSGAKNIILNDVRLYFAPFIGAIDGIKEEITK
ncbi:hypothetical protein [Herminiimonas fonticola]|uniref:Uncharacterized protein n=1 Tax=Herminiimonas fonticola TaxID=303380 RepID=A0A4R6FZ77_9BURK|nr:hypothetical protein [Herminiimonas fonticola]RBA24357.1 hypothetical protein Hfont_2169 [Herminiimonas fonticola]TDN87301.1 hypothetical protein EV677_3012 [Herminiimonas fonticola]